MEINADYVIRRTILFDNKCGFVLGESPKAPNPYVTWQFNEQDGHRDYFWGHYHNEPDMAERDLHNRAEDYQRRYHVQEVEQAPDKETYKYYSTQRPIDIGTYPKSYFNRPIHMDVYFTRQQVPGEAFQAWGAITYAQPLTDREMQDYELRPARENLDIRRQMDAQAQVVGKWEDAHHVPEQRREPVGRRIRFLRPFAGFPMRCVPLLSLLCLRRFPSGNPFQTALVQKPVYTLAYICSVTRRHFSCAWSFFVFILLFLL